MTCTFIRQTTFSTSPLFKVSLEGGSLTQVLLYLVLICNQNDDDLGPVVQSVISLTSLLVIKMLTVLVNTISNSQLFLLKKM